MARKHSLTELTAVNSDDSNSENPLHKGTEEATKTARRAVGAVSQSFEKLKMKGEIEIDPSLIDPAPIKDRLEIEGPKLDQLVEQIKEHGQQVAILVRPHPSIQKRYQLAYGRRRTAAAKALGIKVRAIVKTLTDNQLVLAQGQENNERLDLSFIEKALYAVNLEEGGYDRSTIMAALSIDKTICSRLISTVNNISRQVIEKVGAAPSIGRDRWLSLATHMKDAKVSKLITDSIEDQAFQKLDSDARFEFLLKKAAKKPQNKLKSNPEFWKNGKGQNIAKIKKSDQETILAFNQKLAPDFGIYVLESLPDLFEKYQKSRDK